MWNKSKLRQGNRFVFLLPVMAIAAVFLFSDIENKEWRINQKADAQSSGYTVLKETRLWADGPGGTYELIEKVLRSEIESPDRYGNHTSGWTPCCQHIIEAAGGPTGNYFRFFLHPADNDKGSSARNKSRNEIKGDGGSPAEVLATQGETVRYHWYFKPVTSFAGENTIIFQLHNKDTGPIVKFVTTNNGSTLGFSHDRDNCNCGSEKTLDSTPLGPLRNQWLEVEVFAT